MSAKSDPGQGMAPPKKPRAIPVAKPDTKAMMRADQRAIDVEDAALTRPRRSQKVANKRDWRRG